MNQLLISNNWLSLFEYNLHVSDKIAHISTDDKEIIIGKLQISVAKGKNLNATHCPLKGVIKGKDDRETDCKTVFNDSEECYFITSELTTSGDYSLQILLNDKILHQQPFKFTLISSEDIHAPEQKSYGSKERIDELGPVFMEQEMQCPNCKEFFSLNDEESFPRVLPCLHIMGTNCILKEIKNRSVQCVVCEAKHSVPDGDLTCFPKDETRKNLSIYWHLRSEEDYVHCTEHKSARATFLCQKCGEFVCEVCSGSHLGDTHPPLVRVPKLEALKETPVSKLYSYHPCEAEGHEDRMLELFCITCEKLICHECHFDVHQKHKVDKVKAVYEKRRAEIRDILEKAIKTKAIATAVASETRDELEALGKNVGQELNEVRKVFNNCKTKLDARKKTVENELTSKASTKENKMRSQLTDLEDLERSIEISSNRALDLIEFSSEVSFLKLFTTLKKRLGTVSDSCRRSYVCENGLIKYLDDNISDKIVKITNQPGRVWSCSVCLPKTKHWTFPAVAKERAEVLKLQFVDYEEKTTSPANFKEFIKTEVFDSKGQNTPQVSRETVYSEDMLSVRATFSEPGDYRMMVHVLDTPVTKSGYTIHVQKEVEKKAKISNRENESKTTERDISRGSDVLREYHKEDLKDGDRVVRGPTWKWEDQGGVAGTKGTVKLIDSKAYDGWLQVTWDNGDVNVYRKDASHADVILAPSAEQQ